MRTQLQTEVKFCFLVVYILTLFLPLHCQDNPFYQKVVDAQIISEPRRSIAFSSSRPLMVDINTPAVQSNGGLTYFDRNGVPVTDPSNYYGILYAYDKYGRLLPVRDSEEPENSSVQPSHQQETKKVNAPAFSPEPTVQEERTAERPKDAPASLSVPQHVSKQPEVIVINNTTERSYQPSPNPAHSPLFYPAYPHYLPPPSVPSSPTPVPTTSAPPVTSPVPIAQPAVAPAASPSSAASNQHAKDTVVVMRDKRRKRKRKWRLPYLVQRTRRR